MTHYVSVNKRKKAITSLEIKNESHRNYFYTRIRLVRQCVHDGSQFNRYDTVDNSMKDNC